MQKIDTDYAAFERAMDEDRIYEDRAVTYSEICRSIGADPSALDVLLRKEIGYSGDCLLALYRSQTVETL